MKETIKSEKKKDKISLYKQIKLTITAKLASLRFRPTVKSKLLYKLNSGEQLDLISQIIGKPAIDSDMWYRTSKGYIHSSQATLAIVE